MSVQAGDSGTSNEISGQVLAPTSDLQSKSRKAFQRPQKNWAWANDPGTSGETSKQILAPALGLQNKSLQKGF